MNTIVDDQNGYSVSIPESTDGHAVSVRSGSRNDIHVMHAETPDQSTIYFEVTTYPTRLAHQALMSGQHAFLADNAENANIGDASSGKLGGLAATSFDFEGWLQGRMKTRRFLFVDTSRTYRVVYDPTSSHNEAVLDSLRFSTDATHSPR